MKELTYSINGINHVLIVYPLIPGTNKDKLESYLKEKNIILQSATPKEYGGWLFGGTYVELNLLVPESVVLDFNNASFK